MDWIKKHVDTVIVLGGILTAVFWMNTKFANIDTKFALIDKEFAMIDKDISLIKALLIMKNIMPQELAIENNKEE